LGLLDKLGFLKGKNSGFRSVEKSVAQGELRSPRTGIPALKNGAFRAISEKDAGARVRRDTLYSLRRASAGETAMA
jgi:hypothetical protein